MGGKRQPYIIAVERVRVDCTVLVRWLGELGSPIHHIPTHYCIGRVADDAFGRDDQEYLAIFVVRTPFVLPGPVANNESTPMRPTLVF